MIKTPTEAEIDGCDPLIEELAALPGARMADGTGVYALNDRQRNEICRRLRAVREGRDDERDRLRKALADCRNAMWADNPADGWLEIIQAANAALSGAPDTERDRLRADNAAMRAALREAEDHIAFEHDGKITACNGCLALGTIRAAIARVTQKAPQNG